MRDDKGSLRYIYTQATTQSRLWVWSTKGQSFGHGQFAVMFGDSSTLLVASLPGVGGRLVGCYRGGSREESLHVPPFQHQAVVKVLLNLVEVVDIIATESVFRWLW